MLMSAVVEVTELHDNLQAYLKRAEQGERLIVTDHDRPVAEVGPPARERVTIEQLIAEGRATRPTRRGLPEPLKLGGDPYALSRALKEVRGECCRCHAGDAESSGEGCGNAD